MEKIITRCGAGLGDSLYLHSVARHFVGLGHEVEVLSDWPDVFRSIAVTVRKFKRSGTTRLAHYATRKQISGTTQFEDCCINAGITGPVELRLDRSSVNREIVSDLRSHHRPVIAVQMPRAPMGRTDGFGIELLPDCSIIQRIISRIGPAAYFVQIGAGVPLFNLAGIHLDLANRTSVCDLLDVASAADGFLGQCSFIVPLAESLRRSELLVWARRGLNSENPYIRAITPDKILHRPDLSKFVIDDCSDAELAEAADAFLEQVRRQGAV